METSAVYWESKVKIYGFHKIADLSLIELALYGDQIHDWSCCIQELDGEGVKFNLTLFQWSGDNKLHLFLVFRSEWEQKITDHIQKKIKADAGDAFRARANVALIHFQGPHFGDRYGIADAAFRILTDHHISIIASGFSGSAIHLVLPGDTLEKAERLLSSAFEVPRTVNFRGQVIIHDPSSKQQV